MVYGNTYDILRIIDVWKLKGERTEKNKEIYEELKGLTDPPPSPPLTTATNKIKIKNYKIIM